MWDGQVQRVSMPLKLEDAIEVRRVAGSTPVSVGLLLGVAEGSMLPALIGLSEATISAPMNMISVASRALSAEPAGSRCRGEGRMEEAVEARKLPMVAPRCRLLGDGERRTEEVQMGSTAEGDRAAGE